MGNWGSSRGAPGLFSLLREGTMVLVLPTGVGGISFAAIATAEDLLAGSCPEQIYSQEGEGEDRRSGSCKTWFAI